MGDPVTFVVSKYVSKGWQALDVRSRQGPNDIIAQVNVMHNGKVTKSKFHFVQVVVEGKNKNATNDTTTTVIVDEAKNAFIQNAFSNGAVPIIAFVKITKARAVNGISAQKIKITFKDANTNSRVVV